MRISLLKHMLLLSETGRDLNQSNYKPPIPWSFKEKKGRDWSQR